MMETGYQIILNGLYKEILDKVKSCTPRFFEILVVELLLTMGYGGSLKDAGKAIGQSGDGGIDGIIKEDKLGLDVIYIQAKRWEGSVGRPEIQKFVGSLVGNHANKGVFITTSFFSKDAENFVKTIQHKVVLIDGATLAQYMVDYDLGVTKEITYDIKRIDNDFFVEE
jgi:restriction system protein